MSSSTCKCVFRLCSNAKGGPVKLNFEGLRIQKWDIQTHRAQRVDEKNGVICLVIMLSPRVTVIKMSKMAYFLATAKK